MICATCGRDNPNHLVFCQECEQKLAPRIAPPTPPVGVVPFGAPRPATAMGAAVVPAPAPVHAIPAASAFGHAAGGAAAMSAFATSEPANAFSATAFADPSAAPRPSGPPAQNISGRPSAPDFSFAPRAANQPAPAMPAAPAAPAAAKAACVRCGAWNDVGLRFCVACGGSMGASVPPVPAAAPAPVAVGHLDVTRPAEVSPISARGGDPMHAPAIAPARVVSVAAPAPPETVRVCARCRGACDATAQFCRFCGASLAESAPLPSGALPSSQPSQRGGPHAHAHETPGRMPVASQAPATDPIPPPPSTAAPSVAGVAGAGDIPRAPRTPSQPDSEPRDSRDLAIALTSAKRAEARASAPTATSMDAARSIAMNETSMLHGAYSPAIVTSEILPKARLVVIAKDGGEGPSYPIGEGMDIGRSEGHITIPEDRYLSPRHARIRRDGSGRDARLLLKDLGSTNGIYLRLRAARPSRAPSAPNAPFGSGLGGLHQTRESPERADMATPPASEPFTLTDQDLFLVGQQVLRFEVVSDAPGEAGLGPASQHGTLLFGTPAAPRYARLSQRTVEGVSRDVFYIRKAETVLGRESGDIVFTEDPFLSRRHAAIRVESDAKRFLLSDLGSSNGTFVQLRGEVVLQTGDQFRIGQQLFRIDIA